MKKFLFIPLLFVCSMIFSQEIPEVQEQTEIQAEEKQPSKIFLKFDEGLAFAHVTRIQKEENRSNFVWENSMIGIYGAIQTENLPLTDVYFRCDVLYPFLNQFNGMQQYPKQTVLYAFDFFLGIPLQYNKIKYVKINFVPGLHGMYQLSDEYHLGYFGAGAILGAEFPIARRWTILLDGDLSFNTANLGSNSSMQPFDISWKWGAHLGVRYSKRKTNTYSYLSKQKEEP